MTPRKFEEETVKETIEGAPEPYKITVTLDGVTAYYLDELAEHSIRTPLQQITFLIHKAFREHAGEIAIARNLRKGTIDDSVIGLKKMLE